MIDAGRRNELRALFSALQDGTLSSEDHARLERALAADADARQLWFLHCDLETGLAEWAAAREQQPAANVIAAPRSVFRRAWRWAAPIAAMAALFVLTWRLVDRPPRTAPEAPATGLAVLGRTVGVEWEGEPLNPGTVLSRGTLRLKSGAALVEFYSGARVVVEGPAEFELLGAGEAYLHAGKINAHVPPPARGFAVGSANLKVVDHGTDFGFEIKADAAPEVHVFTGEVEITRATVPPLSLRHGEAVRLEGGALTRMPATRSSFLTELELAQRDLTQAQARIAAMREATSALVQESATLIYFTFHEGDPTERRVENRKATAGPETHGVIIGGTWTDGRWPGKRALEFRGEGDRVRCTAAQPMSEVTLLAWVRVNSLPRAQNVLLASDSEQPGALHW
ncbi:MAG TPA: hypothetical protein VGO11_03320, partial [Chthoniobacteraceae bacterium]|nr:hypothetical protein [Chthoniobacteraceae bacterium]